MPTALVTDSNSQLPAELAERFDVEVVPIAVIVDGTEYLEGVDLDADGFYAFFADGHVPEVSTSQPSPGAFIETYQRCIDRGCDEIVSIHVTDAFSGTLNSARLAAQSVDVPVHLVDTGSASFGISCCVWQAGLALADGADPAGAVAAATEASHGLYSVSAIGVSKLFNRVAFGSDGPDTSGDGVEMLATEPDGTFQMLGKGHSAEEVCDRLADAMRLNGEPIRVALGIADESAMPYYEGLESRLADRADVVEIVRYRIGPSVGAFFGPGTAGGFWYRA